MEKKKMSRLFFCKPSLGQSPLVHNPPMVFYPRISFAPERNDPAYNEQDNISTVCRRQHFNNIWYIFSTDYFLSFKMHDKP